MRVALTGEVTIEAGGVTLAEQAFGGRRVRLLLAVLVLERERPLYRDELAEVVWPNGPPPTWEPGLRGLVTKVRGLLALAGLRRTAVLTHSYGCYQLHLPDGVDVDVETAASMVEQSEPLLRTGDADRALELAMNAGTTLVRPFLPGEEGDWPERQRSRLHALLQRALLAQSVCRRRRGETAAAQSAAEEMVRLAPFSDSGYRQLMEAHAAAGNTAEALRAYESLRILLAEELGIDPAPETQALHVSLLRQSADAGAALPARYRAAPVSRKQCSAG